MPQSLESIVQKMIDAGEPEENIGAVIREYKSKEKAQQPYTGPTSFWGGVGESLKSGEAAKAGLQGGLGYLKGATLDIPSSVVGGLKTIGNLVTDPIGTIGSIPEGISNIWETTKKAGTYPEEFGRMMGQTTGQPLVTAGAIKAAPTIAKAAGTPIAAVGKTMERWQPVSGMLPNFADIRTLRNFERYLGGKIHNIGERLKTPTLQGELMEPYTPWAEGEFRPAAPELPPSNVSYTGRPAEPFGVIPETTATRGIQPAAEYTPAPPTTQYGYAPQAPAVGVLPKTTVTQGIQPPRGVPTPPPAGFTEGEIIPPAQLPAGTPRNVRIGYPPEPSGYIPKTTQTKGIQPPGIPETLPPQKGGMPTTVKLKQKFVSRENVENLKRAGYTFVNVDPQGGFIFQKVR